HGTTTLHTTANIIDYICYRLPVKIHNGVLLVDLSEKTNPFGLNLLEHSDKGVDHDVDVVLGIFKHLSAMSDPNFWGARLEMLLRNSLYTLWFNTLTLDALPFLLDKKEFRASCIKHIPDSARWISYFWENQYNDLSDYLKDQHAESTLNRVYPLLS